MRDDARVNHSGSQTGARVAIVGGGVAGLEAMLALSDMAGDRAQLTLVSAEPDFLYKPLLVEEPFDLGPAERHELAPLAEEKGARFVLGSVAAVRPEEKAIELEDGSSIDYDYLVVCIGGRFRPAFESAITFPSRGEAFRVDELLDKAAEGTGRIAFVVPQGVSWSLPLYEIALMTSRRVAERGLQVSLALVTPEDAPLAIFGPVASEAVDELLRARQVEVFSGATARESSDGSIALAPGNRALNRSEVVALPAMEGPGLAGLPADEHGFIPIDQHARVRGLDDVYAAGDGVDFPIKQGGIGTQQADAAVAQIAHRLGAAVDPEPFRPVLRGKLLTGDVSVSLRSEVAGGGGEGEVSLDVLWWPPHKISGRYLAPFLYHGDVHEEPEPPRHSLAVEVALPYEWHEQPLVEPDTLPKVD
jgi:sulfide:quinone oxidoreductase